jgi:hypothetical protein
VLEAFGAERLDHLHGRQRLGCQGRDLPLLGPLTARHVPDPLLVVHGRRQQQRGHHEGDEREEWVEPEGHREHPDQHEGGRSQGSEGLGEQVPHGVDVAGHPVDEVARGPVGVEHQGQPLQMLVDGDPQVVDDLLTRPVQPELGEEVGLSH